MDNHKMQILMQLHQNGLVSTDGLIAEYDIDYDAEVEKMRQEQSFHHPIIASCGGGWPQGYYSASGTSGVSGMSGHMGFPGPAINYHGCTAPASSSYPTSGGSMVVPVSFAGVTCDGVTCNFDLSGVNLFDKVELPAPKSVCPDCKGTKVYIGLLKKSPCSKCNGEGTI